MDVFNNREIALAIWLFILLTVAITKHSIRKSLYNLVKAFTQKLILIPLGMMATYIGFLIYGLYEAGVWDHGQLKNTLVWSVSVAAVSLFRVNQIANDPHYFRRAVKDNLKLLVVLEFIIAFYTFPLWVELLIVPLTALAGGMLAMAQSDKKYEPAEKLLNNCLALFGGGLIAYAAYKLLTDFGSFAKPETLGDFSLPPLLSLLYLPFLFVMALYVSYENVFIRLHFSIKDSSLRAYAKRRAILAFHLRTGLLKRWARNLMTSQTRNRRDIDNAIREVMTLRERERNSVEVPYDRGWSPYAAKDFLKSEGLVTDDYHRVRGDSNEWYSSSPYLEIEDGLMPKNLAYYIEGDETTVTVLKLVMYVYVPDVSQNARGKFLNIARLLFEKALHNEMPGEIENHLSSETEITAYLNDKEIVVSKELWPEYSAGGYATKFVIQNAKEQEIP